VIALAAECPEGERGGLFRWILPASVALHVVVFAWLPSASRSVTSAPLPPVVLEVAEPPLPPPPPKPEERLPAPEPEVAPVPPVRNASPARAVARDVAPRATQEPAAAAPASDAPMDFTSTVFSNDGPGLAVGGGGSSGAAPARAAGPARSVGPKSPAPPRVVPPSSLARRPRAPGLDAELERQYPAEARRSGISGSAVLRVRILPDGRVSEVHIQSESWTGFGPACVRTVRAARWEPPIDRDGTPVATEITYTCRFEVRS